MTWTPDEQVQIKRALLGSWPGTITHWGRDAFGAYLGELAARGLTAGQALTAIRTWPASEWPPSAPQLAEHARHDPARPTFDELCQLIDWVLRARTAVRKGSWEVGEREALDEQARLERAVRAHPLAGSFILRQGFARLARLGLSDPENEYREVRRRELRVLWDQHVMAWDGRQARALASAEGRRGLARLDPLGAITNERDHCRELGREQR